MDTPQPPAAGFPWKTTIAAIAVVVVCALTVWGLMRTAQRPFDAAERVADSVQELVTQLPAIAAEFKTGQITHTFRTSIPAVVGTGGDVLEVAVSESEEIFRREDSKSVFWESLDLGTTVSEVRVPVTFRYHVKLSDPWKLASRDHVCLVQAPAIRPSLPPAIHTDGMEKSTRRGWARFNGDESLAALERSITPTLEQRAIAPARLALVRENSRRSVAAFVRAWLMQEDYWRTDRFTAIVVMFADEATLASESELERARLAPTLEFQVPD